MTLRRCALTIVSLWVLLAAGCVGGGGGSLLNGPLGGVFEPFFPPKPSQIARQATHPATDPHKRRRAIALLSGAPWGGQAPYLRLYRIYLDYPDPTVRAACLRALGRHGEVEDVPRIVKALHHEQAFVRWEAAVALQKIHNRVAITPLIGAVARDEDVDVRIAAVTALGQYARSDVFDALVGALSDRNYGVVHEAEQSLGTLTGQDYGQAPGKWLAWAGKNPGQVFAGHRPYVWQPFDKPQSLLDKAKFWEKRQPKQPRSPTGLPTGLNHEDTKSTKKRVIEREEG